MELDDELCLCFHVTKRKVRNYLRIERPRSASQLSDCFGAGTGCGWCRKTLTKMFEQSRADLEDGSQVGACQTDSKGESGPIEPTAVEPTAAEYARARAAYVRDGGGTPPPGATPIDPE